MKPTWIEAARWISCHGCGRKVGAPADGCPWCAPLREAIASASADGAGVDSDARLLAEHVLSMGEGDDGAVGELLRALDRRSGRRLWEAHMRAVAAADRVLASDKAAFREHRGTATAGTDAVLRPASVEALPPCAASMGCLCAGHARGDDPTLPCNTDEK